MSSPDVGKETVHELLDKAERELQQSTDRLRLFFSSENLTAAEQEVVRMQYFERLRVAAEEAAERRGWSLEEK